MISTRSPLFLNLRDSCISGCWQRGASAVTLLRSQARTILRSHASKQAQLMQELIACQRGFFLRPLVRLQAVLAKVTRAFDVYPNALACVERAIKMGCRTER